MAPRQTDWERYYRHPSLFAPLARRLTRRRILSAASRFASGMPAQIAELGGGNSAFLPAFGARYPLARLTAVDNCPLGLQLAAARMAGSARLRVVDADLREPVVERLGADVVFSVGLIEHFEPADTARIVRAHFDHARPGGLVVMTFPTPTWLYRAARVAAERAGAWMFPDERPLACEEVTREAARYGDVLEVAINWAIVLTQGIVVARVGAGRFANMESMNVDL